MTPYSLIPMFLLACLILTYLCTRRKDGISSFDFLFMFLMLGYGFHACIMTPQHKLSYWTIGTSSAVYYLYLTGLSLCYLGLMFGILLGSVTFKKMTPLDPYPIDNPTISKTTRRVAVLATLAFVMVSLAIDRENYISLCLENVKFLFDISEYSYVEIRRTLFSETSITALMSDFRYAIAPIMASLLLASTHDNRKAFLPNLLVAILMLMLTSIQLNKMFFLYYAVMSMLVLKKSFILENRGRAIHSIVARLPFIILWGFFLTYMLYTLQYRAQIERGTLDDTDLISTLFYRVFFTTSDNLILWFDAYPKIFPFTGFSNIPMFANLFDLPLAVPPSDLPRYYLGTNVLTSWQPGFLASAYASFGFVGILVNSIIVGWMATCWQWIEKSIQNKTLRSCFITVIGLNTFWVFSSQFHTSLASGGYLVSPVIFIFYIKYLGHRKQAPQQ